MRLHSLALLLVVFSFEAMASAQEPADKAPSEAALSRPCSSSRLNPSKRDKRKAKSAAQAKESTFTCLEAKGTSVDLLEFFQSYVREQRWRIGDEKIVEDSWIFSRSLDTDELLQFAKEASFAGRVKWTEGKTLVQITAHELDAGFTRVEVSARFQGIGEGVDRFAPPRGSWDLESTGALGKMLIGALEAHVNSLQ